ncbi:YibE/F family protein [Pelosinus sp. IPA-1]|uniref:YibE/F family protein n=1 Tax=Pelosinus sp. IPA-1 TaxID=3029569 RepID=UPI0024361662|nr:YibE/F family protein [Pelosinus sp. IPA-1]GMA99956.1 membrane protein [Pelosinus sp. IPA-1]
MKQRWYTICYSLIFLGLMAFLFTYFEFDTQTKNIVDSSSSHYENAIVLSKSMLIDEHPDYYQEELVKVRLETGANKGQIVEIRHSIAAKQQIFDLVVNPGDRLVIEILNENGIEGYYIGDFYRIPYFILLLGILLLGLFIFGRITGVKSLIGIGLVLFLLWHGFLAHTMHSQLNIYLLTLLYCGFISLLVLMLVGGFTKKTWAALLGTWGGVFIAGLLSYMTIQLMHLTGIDTEEAVTLKMGMPSIDFQGILFASIIIGALGAIIDVTISIASAQSEIWAANPKIGWRDLYKRGMNVGSDMMGAMVNTLILAYVGGFMPSLLLLASYNGVSFTHIINTQGIMTELIRAIIGSIGLIYAIPLTAIISAILLCCKKPQ